MSDGVNDPLRFGQEVEDLDEEVLLDDEPPAPAPAASDPLQQLGSSGGDPLAQLSGGAAAPPSYRDVSYAPQQQQQQQQPAAAPLDGSSSHPLGAGAGPAAADLPAAAAEPRHRAQASLTLEGLDLGASAAEDAGFLRGGSSAPNGSGASGSGGGAGPSTRPPAAVAITVSDPVRRVGDSVVPGFTATHTEYLVASVWGGAGGRRTQVRRRFKDFVALADLLAITHRGYFVFPRPDKNTLDQQLGKSDFTELRRAECERYLRKLAAHPVAGASQELRVFLEAEGALASSLAWQQIQPARGTLVEGIARLPRQLIGSDPGVPSAMEAQQNARVTGDLLRRFRELGERMRQEYQAPPQLSEDEAALREKRAGVEAYADKLAAASRRAEKMVQEFEEMGAVLGDLGLALVKLAKFEDEEGSRLGAYTELGVGARSAAADARRAGLAAVRHSRLARAANAQAMEALEPLHDELAMSPAVAAALREREAALLTVQSLQDDLGKRRRAAAALEESGARRVGGDAAKQRKAAQLANDIAAAEAALDAAQREYERVRQRNLQELERVRGERASEFGRLVRGCAGVSAEYQARCADIWGGVADDYGAGAALAAQRGVARGTP